jgi:tight adherence protein B
MIVWIPSITFLLVSGLALLGVSLWLYRYSPQAKAKAQRLRNIRTEGLSHQGQLAQEHSQGTAALDKWLREHVKAYAGLDGLIVRAHSDRTALQILGFSGITWAVVAVVALLVGSGLWLALLLGVLGASMPVVKLVRAARTRCRMFEEKLPEALDFMARALRAGHSITVTMGMAGNELADPIGIEFKTVFDEIGFGIPFNDAMTEMARRMNSHDLDFLVIALLIQRETGGNLTELLEGLAKTVRERIKLQGKVRTLSSEGRFSAILLGSLPFVLGAILSLLNPSYMSALWLSPEGHNILIAGSVLLVVGFVSLSRIVRIKV